MESSTCAVWVRSNFSYRGGRRRHTWPVQRGFVGTGLGRRSTAHDKERPNQVLESVDMSGSPYAPFSHQFDVYLLCCLFETGQVTLTDLNPAPEVLVIIFFITVKERGEV